MSNLIRSASVIGSNSAASTTVTVTLTAPTVEGYLAIVLGTLTQGTWDNVDVLSVVDSRGNTYSAFSGTEPFIGLNHENIGTFGVPATMKTIYGGSVGRRTTAGDLIAGDTITITFTSAGAGPGVTFSAQVILAMLASDGPADAAAVSQYHSGISYGNSDQYPTISANANRLSWALDRGPAPASPDVDAFILSSTVALPNLASYAPLEGSLLTMTSALGFSVAVSYKLFQAAGTLMDPGGTWSSASSALTGNYQCFATAPARNPVFRTRHKAHR